MPAKQRRRVLSQPSSGNKRVVCAELCEVEDARGRHHTCRIWNVSVGGVYVAIQPFAKIDEPLTLSFCLPGETQPIRVEGRVAWWNPPSAVRGVGQLAAHLPPGCGVQYLDPSPTARRHIERRVLQILAEDK